MGHKIIQILGYKYEYPESYKILIKYKYDMQVSRIKQNINFGYKIIGILAYKCDTEVSRIKSKILLWFTKIIQILTYKYDTISIKNHNVKILKVD